MKIIPALALGVSLLSGCASTMEGDWDSEPLRDVNQPASWIGATKDELMTAMGPPTRAIHSQGPQGQHTYNYIYSKGDNSQDCIATYLIEKSSGTVLEYSCY